MSGRAVRATRDPAPGGAAAFAFYGGKGGVGKTTCAAARAVAEARAGRRVLVVSTDPAHSLADAFGQRLSGRVTRVPLPARPGRRHESRLDAVHLDARAAFRRWLGRHRRALGDIVEHGTWLDRSDVEALLGLPVPGLDELMGILELTRLARGPSRPALVVVDTSPTGHTLRLLDAPAVVDAVSDSLAALQHDHRLIREQFARTLRPEAADRLVAELADMARAAGDLLRDPARTAFHWVTLPEPLAVEETRDAVAALERARLPLVEVVVNGVVPPGPRCPNCDPQRAAQRAALADIRRTLGRRTPIRVVTARASEPRGARELARLGLALTGRPAAERPGVDREGSRARAPARRTGAGNRSGSTSGRAVFEARLAGRRLVMVLGKGGVGKTTTAAALALTLARARPGRVWLISTDPAHALADVFGEPIRGDAIRHRAMPPNLRLREIDAPSLFAARRIELEAAFDEIARASGAALAASASARGADLMRLAPPGIDELLGLLMIAELTAHDAATVVVDTAPSGHTLRLLQMPGAAHEWVRVLLRLLLKYREMTRPGALARQLVELSRSIRQLDELLHDRDRAALVVVSRAAALSRVETGRLLAALRRLDLPASALVVNALTGATGCARCRRRRTAERREMARLALACRRARCAIIQAPLAIPPPRGPIAIRDWSHAWLG